MSLLSLTREEIDLLRRLASCRLETPGEVVELSARDRQVLRRVLLKLWGEL